MASAPGFGPGLFVAIDPETGRPGRPSASQRRDAAAAAERAGLLAPEGPLQAERLPGGGEIVHLHGKFQTFSVARRDATGRFVTDCAEEADAAKRPLPVTPRSERPREVR